MLMKWARRSIWLLLLAALVAGAVYTFQPSPVPVDVAMVVRGPLEVTIDEDGKTRIKEKYIVSTPVGGRLQRIELREGDPVQSGETILAMIQPSNPDLLDARSLAQAKARVRASEAAVNRAKSRCDKTKVERDQADKDLQRAQQLIESRAISPSEFEKTQAEFRSINELLRSAEFDKEIALFELDLARAALVHVQPDGPTGYSEESGPIFFEIRSPINGVVLRVLQESSTIVSPGTPIVELGDHRDLEIVVDVLSNDAVKISPGTQVRLEQWGGTTALRGTVRLIEPSAFEKVSALGVEEQRVNVIVDFDESSPQDAPLGDGYRVEARMVVWSADDVVKVPTSALFRDRNQWAAFVVENGRVVLTPVTIGHRNDREAEVVDGLATGDTVVLHPGDNLADGAQIVARETL